MEKHAKFPSGKAVLKALKYYRPKGRGQWVSSAKVFGEGFVRPGRKATVKRIVKSLKDLSSANAARSGSSSALPSLSKRMRAPAARQQLAKSTGTVAGRVVGGAGLAYGGKKGIEYVAPRLTPTPDTTPKPGLTTAADPSKPTLGEYALPVAIGGAGAFTLYELVKAIRATGSKSRTGEKVDARDKEEKSAQAAVGTAQRASIPSWMKLQNYIDNAGQIGSYPWWMNLQNIGNAGQIGSYPLAPMAPRHPLINSFVAPAPARAPAAAPAKVPTTTPAPAPAPARAPAPAAPAKVPAPAKASANVAASVAPAPASVAPAAPAAPTNVVAPAPVAPAASPPKMVRTNLGMQELAAPENRGVFIKGRQYSKGNLANLAPERPVYKPVVQPPLAYANSQRPRTNAEWETAYRRGEATPSTRAEYGARMAEYNRRLAEQRKTDAELRAPTDWNSQTVEQRDNGAKYIKRQLRPVDEGGWGSEANPANPVGPSELNKTGAARQYPGWIERIFPRLKQNRLADEKIKTLERLYPDKYKVKPMVPRYAGKVTAVAPPRISWTGKLAR